jgi:hypothetical protein
MGENEKFEIRSTKQETNSNYQNMNDQNKIPKDIFKPIG